MRINPYIFGIMALAIFLGTILAFQAAGVWSVSGKLSSSGEAVQPSADDVNTIKGWMTLEQITATYNVPLAYLLAQFNLPADTPASTAVKDLESDVFSVTGLREWLQSRMEPATPAPTLEPTQVPTTAPILQVTTTPITLPTEAMATPQPTKHTVAEKTVTGKTTFQEILDWGVPEEAIRAIVGGELPELSTVVKDYVTQNGMSFSETKALLQEEVDKTK